MDFIKPLDVDQEVDFYRHFVTERLDGFDPAGARFAEMINRLGQLSAAGLDEGPVLDDALCRHVRIGEGAGKVWTRPALLAELRTIARLKVAPSYADDTVALTELAKAYTRDSG